MKTERGPRISVKLVIAFKKPKATQCSNQCKISLTAHIANINARIPRMKDREEN
jgi:hypothetical protein